MSDHCVWVRCPTCAFLVCTKCDGDCCPSCNGTFTVGNPVEKFLTPIHKQELPE